MTTIPQPDAPDSAYTGKFDAWKRLTQLTDSSTSAIVQQNQYDGRAFRIARIDNPGGTSPETRHFYQSASWRVLEERLGTSPSTVSPDRQYVWGLRYIDDLVLRDRSVSGTLDERFYGLQDANWNMVALSDPSGDVHERYSYSAYGVCTVLNPDFSEPYSGAAYDWTVLYTGRELDSVTGLYYFRYRYLHTNLGIFISRDPIESDLNPYAYCGSAPTILTDPSGLASLRLFGRCRPRCGCPCF